MKELRIASYNCRSVKNSVIAVRDLCESHDICLLQEHWLTKDNISFLSSVHKDFDYYGESPVDTSEKLLLGRPLGGLAILWRKSIGHAIKVKSFGDSRIVGIELDSVKGKICILCVYMPTCNKDNYEDFLDYLANIHSIVQSNDCYNTMIIGDWNADRHSLFGSSFHDFCKDYNYLISDELFLPDDTFTYVSDAHGSTSWVDHCVSTHGAHNCINSISVLYDIISSDHLPLSINCDYEILPICICSDKVACENIKTSMKWDKINSEQRNAYHALSDRLLGDIKIPSSVLCCKDVHCTDKNHIECISQFYDSIINSLYSASTQVMPGVQSNHYPTVAGWNDHVKDLHAIARDTFKLWCSCGKPKYGPLFDLKRRSHARFKYALRACQRNENQVKADNAAKNLCCGNQRQFWRSVSKINAKTPPRPSSVNGCNGDANIVEMWRKHYKDLFNDVHDNKDQNFVEEMIDSCNYVNDFIVSPNDIRCAISKLQMGKAAGSDLLSAEHYIYASDKVSVLLSMCFTAMLVHSFCPNRISETVLVPIIKDKNGDISNKNNYRPIALSTIASKILEFVLLKAHVG